MNITNYKDIDKEQYKLLLDVFIINQNNRCDYSIENYDEGLDVLIDDSVLLENRCKCLDGSMFPEWVYDLKDKFGRSCYMYNNKNEIYTLDGFVFSFLDFYYYLKKENGAHVLSSCCGQIEFI